MSCNYYLITKDAEMAFDLLPRVYMNKERRVFTVHLCLTNYRRNVLLEAHSYKNFDELMKVLKNKSYTYQIEDEYENVYDLDHFIKILESWRFSPEAISYRKEDENVYIDNRGYEFLDGEFR